MILSNSTAATSPSTPASHCSQGALTGTLGLFVQALLAFVAFNALIVKRYCEPVKTRRPWKTWFLDTSKQAVGSGFIHIFNIIISEHLFVGDPCTWYVISFMLDSTLGLVIICFGLKFSLWLILRKRWNLLVFGTYAPPSPCRSWFYQCCIYVGIIVVEKVIITLITLFEFWKELGEWILTRSTNANLELVLVMFVIPLVVNAIIFWIVDNFLKLHHAPVSPGSRKVATKDHTFPIRCDILDHGYWHLSPKSYRPLPLVSSRDEAAPLVDIDEEEEVKVVFDAMSRDNVVSKN